MASVNNVCSIFCTGIILQTVQLKNIYKDSKTFVDMPLRFSPEVVVKNFMKLPNVKSSEGPSPEDLRSFLGENFYPAGSDLLPYNFTDWDSHPPFLRKLKDNDRFYKFGASIHGFWHQLGRRCSADVKENPEKHTLLYTPNPIVVPGGRFRESYYWDTYWIVKGLLVSNMLDTAKGVVENLLYFVDRFGKVPNGGRVYYLTRSQPPLLSEMVRVVYDAMRANETSSASQNGKSTKSIDFLKYAIPLLDKEYNFWKENRTVKDEAYWPLSVYSASTTDPRPESYREDYNLTHQNESITKAERQRLCLDIAAAAESGWDFSSRWFKQPHLGISSIQTTSIIPVDLNAFLLQVEANMYNFYIEVGDIRRSEEYLAHANTRYAAIEAHLWNEKHQQWMDFDMGAKASIERVAASNFIPLSVFSQFLSKRSSVPIDVNISHLEKSFVALNQSDLVGVAGIKATAVKGTNQQWDAPNSWAPIVDILVEGLVKNCGVISGAVAYGKSIANAWLETNLIAFQKSGFMYEKYNADKSGEGGSGGEYTPQVGLGWTNGVALVFLDELWFSTE